MPKREPKDLEEIGKKVILRFDEGVKYAANFRQRIDLLAPYIEPTRSNVQAGQAPGQALLGRMYDSEGISAADLATRQIGSYLHGPGSQWFLAEDENELVNQDDDAREWYQYCRDLMLKQCTDGGFYSEAYESDMDWMGFGAGLMRVEQKPILSYRPQHGFRGTRFTSHKAGRFVVFENGWGEVDETYTELKKTAKAAADLWGVDSLTESMRFAYENGRVEEFRFIHGIYPRKGKEKAYGNKADNFASCYVHYDTKKVMAESGYPEFPDMVPRWSRCYGEPYGRGLGEIALNNLITLNAAVKHDMEAMVLRIKKPLLQRHDAVVGQKRFTPWGVTVVRVQAGQALSDALAPLDLSHDNYQFQQVDGAELKKSIRRIFYADILEQLMALEGQQEMRVYVFQQKQNIVQKMLGPTYGRWEREFGMPMLARLFNLLFREKAFPPPPDIILQLGGQPRIRFDNPLARAQRMEETDSLNQAMSDLNPIVQMQTNEWKLTGHQPADWILDNYDMDKYAQKVNRDRGVSAVVTRSQREIDAIRGSRAEAEQKQAQQQQIQMAAESAGKAAPMVQALQQGQAA